ncbi:DMT family transporter [Jiella marina]|uniref:DMT family transporter n=1 Tax=Jiella sp. LLJ827 TaxID=2917712 RepID=UPI0021016627|nr:DMT family transporter [Jiella sp. LLJ827]MCQ0987622.1 DMT family transporter [Jiella sp. LLJ827]
MVAGESADAPNPMLGIGLKCMSVVVFVGMQTALKAGGEGIPAGQLVFFRSFFALIPVVVYLAWLGDLKTALKTDDLVGHMIRGMVGVCSMVLGFFALTRLPYPEWITISYGAPLLTVVFAAIFLKEAVRIYRWTAAIIGLTGVIIVSLPNLTLLEEGFEGPETIGALAALGSAIIAAIAFIQIRRLVRTEKTATIVIYFSLTCSLLSLLTIFLGWEVPSPEAAALLVTAGLCGGVGQLLLTAAYRYADTSTVAPFEYVSLILAVTIGFFIFDEAVNSTTLAGGAIVVSAGIFIIWREHRLGLERRKARRAAPPNG